MFERFTDRARKVMALANGEAQRFNHEYIGTEHLLLGLIKEGGGVAANILKNLDIDLRKVRLEVEKLVRSGPDIVSLGVLPQTPRTKKVIEYAIEESLSLNHNYIGTEHLLLGLIKERDGAAAQVLLNLGLKLEELREEILNILSCKPDEPTHDEIIRAIALLLIQKDTAIQNAEYDLASQLLDQADKLRKMLGIDANTAENAIKDAVAASNAAVNDAMKQTYIVRGDPVEISDMECELTDQSPGFEFILSRINIAESGIRELLAAVAATSDISVIQHLSRMVQNVIDLRAYYSRLMPKSSTL